MDGKGIIFVTGTDTCVGKTLLTALLLNHLRENGVDALAMKPFCSGGLADVRLLQSLQRGALSDQEMNPYYFSKPVAPLVAQKGRRGIALREVVGKIEKIKGRCDCLIVEGSGGLLVPLGPGFTVADLIKNLKCRVIVVARNRLGTINHTLLTVEALLARGVKKKSISVVMMSQRNEDISCRSNRALLAELLNPIPVLGIPFLGSRVSSPKAVRKNCPKLQKILESLKKSAGIE
jgi:dethiobiotin synthetase